jgi:hypothetical protein
MKPPSREWRTLPAQTRDLVAEYQRKSPVDLSGLARRLGLSVKASTLPPGISGEIRPDGKGSFVIRVSRHDIPGRQRFTVAHEIAHYLLHKHLIGDGIRDDVLYRSGMSSAIEAEANRLASDMIMPSDAVENAAQLARRLGSNDVVAAVADQFGVSEAAMRIKLEK